MVVAESTYIFKVKSVVRIRENVSFKIQHIKYVVIKKLFADEFLKQTI